MSNYADDVDLSANIEETIKERAIEGIREQARTTSYVFTGKCNYCQEPISTGNYCDAECAEWHRQEQAALKRKYGRQGPGEL